MDGHRFFDQIEAEVIRMGGGAKRGLICKRELEEAQEIRVSIRPPRHIGSTELFTLRNIEPGDYQLMLIAIPRKLDSPTTQTDQASSKVVDRHNWENLIQKPD